MSWFIDLRYPFLSPAPVSQPFGVNPAAYAAYGLPYHNGVDFAVITGTPVLAAAPGKVVAVRNDSGGYGTHVRIACEKQGKKFLLIYGHMSQVGVQIYDDIEEGQVIGLSGNTGNSTGPHLHFEVRPESEVEPGTYVSGAYAVDPYPMFMPLEPVVEQGDALYQVIVLPYNGVRVRAGIGTHYTHLETKLQNDLFDVVEEGFDTAGNKWVRHNASIPKWSCWGMSGNSWLQVTKVYEEDAPVVEPEPVEVEPSMEQKVNTLWDYHPELH